MQTLQRASLSIAALVFILCSATEPALARVETFTVDEPIEFYPLYLVPGKTVIIRLESAILETDAPEKWKVEPTLNRSRDTIKLFVPVGATPEEIMGDYLVGTRYYDLTFEIHMADGDNRPSEGLIVQHKNERELFQAAVEQEVARRVDEALADQGKAADAALARAIGNGKEQALLHELNDGHRTRRLTTTTDCQGKGVVVCAVEWNHLKEYGLLRVAVHNRTPVDLEYTRAQVFDEFLVRDHSGAVQVDDGEPMAPDATIISIPRGRTIKLSLIVRNPANIGNAARLSLTGPLVSGYSTFVDLSGPDGELTLSLEPVFGAIWLAKQLDTEAVDPTTIKGLGMRAVYSITRRWYMEGELTFARSGDARFADVPYNGAQGEVTRDVKLVRGLFGGRASFDRKISPSLSAGLGVQAATHDSSFTPDGGVQGDGPGSGFEVDILMYLSTGVDVRITNHWNVGVSASAIGVVKSLGASAISGSTEMGLYFGYRWYPRR